MPVHGKEVCQPARQEPVVTDELLKCWETLPGAPWLLARKIHETENKEAEYKCLKFSCIFIFLFHRTCINRYININKQPRDEMLEQVVVMALRK